MQQVPLLTKIVRGIFFKKSSQYSFRRVKRVHRKFHYKGFFMYGMKFEFAAYNGLDADENTIYVHI